MEDNGHLSKIENPNSFSQAQSWPFESTLESKGYEEKNYLNIILIEMDVRDYCAQFYKL